MSDRLRTLPIIPIAELKKINLQLNPFYFNFKILKYRDYTSISYIPIVWELALHCLIVSNSEQINLDLIV